MDASVGPDRDHGCYPIVLSPMHENCPVTHTIAIQYSPPSDDKLIPSSPKVCVALRWWIQPQNLQSRLFILEPSSCTLTTDASKTHFGKIRMSGLCTPKIAKKHINTLELWAIHLALRKIVHLVRGQKVLVQCDYMSVVTYINKGERRAGLFAATPSRSFSGAFATTSSTKRYISRGRQHPRGRPFQESYGDSGSIESQRIVSGMAPSASSVSDELQEDGQTSHRPVCQPIQRPTADLLLMESGSVSLPSNAMTMSWEGIGAYAFPPKALIPRILLRLTQTKKCKIILICPRWPRQPWLVRLLSLLVDTRRTLPVRRDLIQVPGNPLPMQSIQIISLTAWPLSSIHTERRAFLEELPIWRERQGEIQPERLIIQD